VSVPVAAASTSSAPQDMFRRHMLLAALEERESRELLVHARVQRARAGQVIFHRGDPGDGLYGVMTGRVMVTIESVAGKQLILNTFGPGAFFGEIALLDGGGRTANAVAREASTLVFLARAAFLRFLEARPATALRVISFLCARLRRTTQLVEDATFLSVPRRLAKQIMVLVHDEDRRERREKTPTVRISQAELAQMLGVSREVVSRQLTAWRDAGLVDGTRGRLVVRDLRAMDHIVAGG
jgi:CRP/FNR family cyclic AMP-dependent transcriptional regulator